MWDIFLREIAGILFSSMDLMKENHDRAVQIKTETFLDSLVRQFSVYAVAGIGLFLIVKDFLLGK